MTEQLQDRIALTVDLATRMLDAALMSGGAVAQQLEQPAVAQHLATITQLLLDAAGSQSNPRPGPWLTALRLSLLELSRLPQPALDGRRHKPQTSPKAGRLWSCLSMRMRPAE